MFFVEAKLVLGMTAKPLFWNLYF